MLPWVLRQHAGKRILISIYISAHRRRCRHFRFAELPLLPENLTAEMKPIAGESLKEGKSNLPATENDTCRLLQCQLFYSLSVGRPAAAVGCCCTCTVILCLSSDTAVAAGNSFELPYTVVTTTSRHDVHDASKQ